MIAAALADYPTRVYISSSSEDIEATIGCLESLGTRFSYFDGGVDVFPGDQQQQVRVQLSMVLEAVVSQQLIPTVDGKLVPAFEIMLVNSAIRNLIREGKGYQIDNALFTGAAEGMRTMDGDILRLCKAGVISRENALLYAVNPEALARKL